jgi:hypothetical protein
MYYFIEFAQELDTFQMVNIAEHLEEYLEEVPCARHELYPCHEKVVFAG